MSATFKIIFNGQLQQHADISLVQKQLSQFLNIPHTIAIKLFDGKSYALKKDLTSIEAVKAESSLKKMGLITRVELHQSTALTAKQYPIALKKLTKHDDAEEHKTSNSKRTLLQKKTNSIQTIITRYKYDKVKLQRSSLKSLLYLCYIALLVMTITGLTVSYNLLSNTMSESQSNTLTGLTYQDYKQYITEQKAVSNQQKTNLSANNNAQQSHDSEQFNRFSLLINSYADSVKQPNIEKMGGEKLNLRLQEIDDLGEKNAFWLQLINLAKSLNNDAHTMSTLNNTDPNKVQWINAVDWISQRYIRQQQNGNAHPKVNQPNNAVINLTLSISVLSLLILMIIVIKMKLRTIRES